MAITVSRLYSDNNGPAQNWIESLFGLTAGQTLLSVDMTWFVRPSPQSGAANTSSAHPAELSAPDCGDGRTNQVMS